MSTLPLILMTLFEINDCNGRIGIISCQINQGKSLIPKRKCPFKKTYFLFLKKKDDSCPINVFFSFKISIRLEDLRVKLENEGLVNISYMVVNHQGIHSQLKIHTLKEKVSENIIVYQQDENQTDVWTTLNGNKDDFLIYDRCGRLVYHLGLPYSFLTFPYVEDSIKIAYCEYKCGNCSYMRPVVEDICKNISQTADEKPAEEAPKPHNHHSHHHNQRRHHGHRHHHQEGDQLSEEQNQQDSAQAPRNHSHQSSQRHNRVVGRNRQGQKGSQPNVETAPQREVGKVPTQVKRP
uniref:Selenoprotein P n=1 Tax=Terrapene triunguis TaxID=2587831 RepID=A0A674I5S1_9SAUR